MGAHREDYERRRVAHYWTVYSVLKRHFCRREESWLGDWNFGLSDSRRSLEAVILVVHLAANVALAGLSGHFERKERRQGLRLLAKRGWYLLYREHEVYSSLKDTSLHMIDGLVVEGPHCHCRLAA